MRAPTRPARMNPVTTGPELQNHGGRHDRSNDGGRQKDRNELVRHLYRGHRAGKSGGQRNDGDGFHADAHHLVEDVLAVRAKIVRRYERLEDQ